MINPDTLITQWPDTYQSLYDKALLWIEARYVKGSLHEIPDNLRAPKDALEDQLNVIWLEDQGIEAFRKKMQEWCRLWLLIEKHNEGKNTGRGIKLTSLVEE